MRVDWLDRGEQNESCLQDHDHQNQEHDQVTCIHYNHNNLHRQNDQDRVKGLNPAPVDINIHQNYQDANCHRKCVQIENSHKYRESKCQ